MFVHAILIALSASVLTLPSPNIRKLEDELFDDLDFDNNKVITRPDTLKYFQTTDTNEDGEINVAEFTASIDSVDSAFTGHETVLYSLFDRDGNKRVTKADLGAVFLVADTNKDNKIDRKEFNKLFETVASILP